MADHVIIGVHITDRFKEVPAVQAIFTEYGCNIKTRLGLHEVAEGACAPRGLIILEMIGCEDACKAMIEKLRAIEGVDVESMVFEHSK